MEKIIRSICYFSTAPDGKIIARLRQLETRLTLAGYQVQTRRLVAAPGMDVKHMLKLVPDKDILLGLGAVDLDFAQAQLSAWATTSRVAFFLDGDHAPCGRPQVDWLFQLLTRCPANTFNFAFGFNIPPSSPFFPSARYQRNGFSVGLQPINLATGCTTVEQWLGQLENVWSELTELLGAEEDFLGIDSSLAPLFDGNGSLVRQLDRLAGGFTDAITGPLFTRLSDFVSQHNPQPVGLCGLMFPCLEDFGLAELYERGEFSLERNLFLSLHSGLGIDTYPVAMDESPAAVLKLLLLVESLAHKYGKPLSVRLVSDGSTRIEGYTAFTNPYLRDVRLRPFPAY